MTLLAHHLGDRVAALVDGELSDAEREAALSHAAGCPRCGDDVRSARLLKAALAGVASPQLAPDLLLSLSSLTATGGLSLTPERSLFARPALLRSADVPGLRRVVAGGMGVMVAGMVGASMLAAPTAAPALTTVAAVTTAAPTALPLPHRVDPATSAVPALLLVDVQPTP